MGSDKLHDQHLKTGDTFIIGLKENPSTGYTWHLKIKTPHTIALVSEKFVPDSHLIGAPGVKYWEFKALKKGSAIVKFKLYREKDEVEKTLKFKIS